MRGRLGRLWSLLRRRLWFRASLFGVAAVVAVLLAAPLPGLLPEFAVRRAAEAPIAELLTILASSMLAVATFSLGALVTALGSATSHASPRAARLLIDDPISQNALSTFIGAFVFAIVGLLALGLEIYGDGGRATLLVATMIVIGLVTAALFGWVDYLTNLSRLGVVVNKLEVRAAELLEARARAPYLGARGPAPPPEDAAPIRIARTGYLTHIDLGGLDAVAARAGGALHLALGPGALIDPKTPVAHASWPVDLETQAAIAACFDVGVERTLDQDARHALIVLSEVAQRALSPGVNDPGTAIGVISRQQRLLTDWAGTAADAAEPAYPRLHLPGLDADDLVEDAFGPLARDGAGIVEVGLRLQKSLRALAGLGHPALAAAAAAQSARALAQAEPALVLESDRARVAAAADAVAAAGGLAPPDPAPGSPR